MKKKSLPVTNIGTISLIMIFIVLCMVTFAALSLSSAASDARLGQKMQAQLTGYYAASNKAEELLAQTDRILADTGSKTADTAEFFARVSKNPPVLLLRKRRTGSLHWPIRWISTTRRRFRCGSPYVLPSRSKKSPQILITKFCPGKLSIPKTGKATTHYNSFNNLL